MLGKARKSVGNITLCYTKGKNIAKAKVFSRKDNPTPEVFERFVGEELLKNLRKEVVPQK